MLFANSVDEATRAAIRSELDSNIFVAAGAGTGKTTSLVSRILALIESGVGIDRKNCMYCEFDASCDSDRAAIWERTRLSLPVDYVSMVDKSSTESQ